MNQLPSFLSFFYHWQLSTYINKARQRKDQNNEIIKQKHHPSINELNKTNYFMSNQRDTTI
jgi:hypothetical protein